MWLSRSELVNHSVIAFDAYFARATWLCNQKDNSKLCKHAQINSNRMTAVYMEGLWRVVTHYKRPPGYRHHTSNGPKAKITQLKQYTKQATNSRKYHDVIPVLTVSCLKVVSQLRNPNLDVNGWKAPGPVTGQQTSPPSCAVRGVQQWAQRFQGLWDDNDHSVSSRQPSVFPESQVQTTTFKAIAIEQRNW